MLEFELVNGVQIDRTYFSDLARGAVKKAAPQLFVMTRESTEVLLQANGKTLADCIGECEIEIGRKLGADYIISGRITQIGSSEILTMRLFSTADGALMGDEEALGKSQDQLLDAAKGAVEKLIAPLSGHARATPEVGAVHFDREAQPSAAVTAPLLAGRVLPSTVDVIVRSVSGDDLSGSQIAVDGEVKGTAPASIPLSAGKHVIVVTRDLYSPKSTTLALEPSELEKLTFELQPDFALATITSMPSGASVSIDDVTAGQTPLRDIRLRTGTHTVVAALPEYLPATDTFVAKADQRIEQPMTLVADFGPMQVNSIPDGAQVLIDNASAGRTPLTLPRVKAGQHVVQIVANPISYDA